MVNSEPGEVFRTTMWSEVLTASGESEDAEAALENLCRRYWRPLFVFIRRKGYDAHQSEDLIQEFFRRFLEAGSLAAADREKGKFRTFLLGSLKHFLANDWRDRNRLKRGGGQQFLSLEELRSESLGSEGEVEPEKAFDRSWARVVIAEAQGTLREEMAADGHAERFETLSPYLQGMRPEVSYAELARSLSLSESATKTVVFRMRRRFGELIRTIISDTVSVEEDVEEEIKYLIEVLSDAGT